MSETESTRHLTDAINVNPFDIGKDNKQCEYPNKSPFNNLLKKIIPSDKENALSDREISDLLRIDSGGVTLEDIKTWANHHVYYYTSQGKVHLNPSDKRDFEDAKTLKNLLNIKNYTAAAVFFLKKAKQKYNGIHEGSIKNEFTMRIIGENAVLNIPQEIKQQGETAIRNYLAELNTSTSLRLTIKQTPVYIRQAATLARIIINNKQK